MRTRHADADADRGAAVAEFAMISVLLMILLFAVLQVAVYFYVRNVVAASAAAGARYGASEGADYPDGANRASELIAQGSTDRVSKDIVCTGAPATDAASGLIVEQVRCHGPVTLIFLPLDLPLTIDVTAQSLKEQVPR